MTTTQQINDGGTAFPLSGTNNLGGPIMYTGMSLRDWFAGMALQGRLANCEYNDISFNTLAVASYNAADAMIEARKKDYVIDPGEDR
jgi:hypothetical protein